MSQNAPRRTLKLRAGLELPIGGPGVADGPAVMGIVNVTPDSFSDGGRFVSEGGGLDPGRATEHALRLLDEGADIVDLGAESTRPGGGVYGDGMQDVPADEELNRLLPVLAALRPQTDAVISVDTRKGEVARAVLDAGADLINDVGGLADPELVRAVAAAGCPVVVMHSRGSLANMQQNISFDDVVREVRDELLERVETVESAGITRDRIVIDPGIGFGKTARQNLELVAGVGRLAATGLPVLMGASRKSFLAAAAGDDSPPDRRLGGSLAAVAWSARLGAAILRVHDVAETVQFLRLDASLSTVAASKTPETTPAAKQPAAAAEAGIANARVVR